jgi:hypothetical protein
MISARSISNCKTISLDRDLFRMSSIFKWTGTRIVTFSDNFYNNTEFGIF